MEYMSKIMFGRGKVYNVETRRNRKTPVKMSWISPIGPNARITVEARMCVTVLVWHLSG